jgi:hypothetical protein
VRDELGDGLVRVEIPDGARRVDGGCDHELRGLFVPRKVGNGHAG